MYEISLQALELSLWIEHWALGRRVVSAASGVLLAAASLVAAAASLVALCPNTEHRTRPEKRPACVCVQSSGFVHEAVHRGVFSSMICNMSRVDVEPHRDVFEAVASLLVSFKKRRLGT